MTKRHYTFIWKRADMPEPEKTEIDETSPLTALAMFHATAQRAHKLPRDGYTLLSFKQSTLSEYDIPTTNPEVTDEFLSRLPVSFRKQFEPKPEQPVISVA